MAQQYSLIFIGICIALISHKTFARIKYEPCINKPDIPLMIDDYGNDSEEYNELIRKELHQQKSIFLKNWPHLKDLVSFDCEDSSSNSNMFVQPMYLEVAESLPTAQARKAHPINMNDFKDHWEGKNRQQQKKNSNYMSACHFKICNLGRKRNVRFVNL